MLRYKINKSALTSLMAARGITVFRVVAAKMDMDASQFCLGLNSTRGVSADFVERLCAALDCERAGLVDAVPGAGVAK